MRISYRLCPQIQEKRDIEVSEEVYRAYIRPIRAEQRRKRREWKCSKLSKTGGYYVRCNERCETCPYYQSGNNALGNNLSLDKMAEDGVDLADPQQDVENRYIEEETQKEEKKKLYEAISKLTLRQQEFVRLIFFEGKTQEEVRKEYGIAKSSMGEAMDRIYATLDPCCGTDSVKKESKTSVFDSFLYVFWHF